MSFFFASVLPDVAVDVAQNATSTYVEVVNGQLETESGSSMVLNSSTNNADSFTEIKSATPTGRLEWNNGDIYVGGSGPYEITNGSQTISTIDGAAPDSTGEFYINTSGALGLEYTTTTTNNVRNQTAVTSESNLPITVSADPPSSATNVFSSAAVKVAPDRTSSDGLELTVEFDTNADNTTDINTGVTDYSGDDSNSVVRDKNQDTQGKKVYANYYQSHGNYSSNDFEQATVAVEWDEQTTTTNLDSVTLV